MKKFNITQHPDASDVQLYTPVQFHDDRGYFEELFNIDYLGEKIEQISHSMSHKNTFRGFHLQFDPKMDKFMYVPSGSATIYFFDPYPYRKRFLKVYKTFLPAHNRVFVRIPWYMAVGFVAHENNTEMMYFQTAPVNFETASTINYRSGIDLESHFRFYRENGWHISEKDENAPLVFDWLDTPQGRQYLTANEKCHSLRYTLQYNTV